MEAAEEDSSAIVSGVATCWSAEYRGLGAVGQPSIGGLDLSVSRVLGPRSCWSA